MLKLCGFAISNYVNKVRLALLEKEIPHELDMNCFPSQDESLLKRSPLGKVPFLETEHGILTESQIICDYLEDRFPEKPLYPRDPYQRAKVRELIQILELHIELVARRVYGQVLFGQKISEETLNDVRAGLAKGTRALAHHARFAPYIAGHELTLADLAAACHLPLVSLMCSSVLGQDPMAQLPQVQEYLKLLHSRPSVQKVEADRQAAMAAFMAAKRA